MDKKTELETKKAYKERYKTIADRFFEIDHENKVAIMRLEFEKPSDIFDFNALTKRPMLSDDFFEWIRCSFDYIPKKYKIDIDVEFDDLEGYREDELKEIFIDNCLLEASRAHRLSMSKNKVAIGLFITGIVFTIGMIFMDIFWLSGDPLRVIAGTVIEIAAWVTIWESLDIFLIENKERRRLKRNLMKRYNSIRFAKKQK